MKKFDVYVDGKFVGQVVAASVSAAQAQAIAAYGEKAVITFSGL